MNKPEKGFTLIELLVVIAIISILAGLIIIRVGGASQDAKDSTRKAHLNQILKSIGQFRLNGGVCAAQVVPHNMSDANGNVFTVVDRNGNYPNNYLSGDMYPKDPEGGEYQVDLSYTSCIVQLSSGSITVSN